MTRGRPLVIHKTYDTITFVNDNAKQETCQKQALDASHA
jgi:hypothetical protein